MVYNVLIGCPSPRDISEFQEALSKLNCDKFIVKYRPAPEAYELIRDFFLAGEWSYLCLIPDDLIVSREGFQTLLGDLEQFQPKVISGVCNVDADTMKDYYIVRLREGEPFLKKEERKYSFARYQIVWCSGFACCFIARNIVEKIPFRQYSPTFETSFDTSFSQDCAKHKIPILVDWKADFQHLEYRLGGGRHENFYKGILEPYEQFIAHRL